MIGSVLLNFWAFFIACYLRSCFNSFKLLVIFPGAFCNRVWSIVVNFLSFCYLGRRSELRADINLYWFHSLQFYLLGLRVGLIWLWTLWHRGWLEIWCSRFCSSCWICCWCSRWDEKRLWIILRAWWIRFRWVLIVKKEVRPFFNSFGCSICRLKRILFGRSCYRIIGSNR